MNLFGVAAEFEHPDDLMRATRAAYGAGYRKMDAYSPIPVHGLEDALGVPYTRLPLFVFACGLLGAIVGFSLCYFSGAEWYPMNIGGRPYLSWPAFIPVTFECTVLFAAFGAVFGMLFSNNLPLPYHPMFNLPSFDRASVDRFFLCIEATDPKFDPEEVKQFLTTFDPKDVAEVEE